MKGSIDWARSDKRNDAVAANGDVGCTEFWRGAGRVSPEAAGWLLERLEGRKRIVGLFGRAERSGNTEYVFCVMR